MSLLKSPLVVVDTETTGLPKDSWAHVIEIGAVLLDRDGQVIDTFETLVIPPVLDERVGAALAINHITREDIAARGCDPHGAALSFLGWLDTHGRPWMTAYNVRFDRAMLERMGVAHPRWASCVQVRATETIAGPGARFVKLSAAAEHFGVEVTGQPHRALTDARTAASVACAILRIERAR